MNHYKTTITVTEKHIDNHKHVNNLVYLQWCLDIAETHWNHYASDTIKEKYIWYVLNHNINYRASAFKGDTLEVQTWVESAEGVKSVRKYKIIRPKDHTILIEASTIGFIRCKNHTSYSNT